MKTKAQDVNPTVMQYTMRTATYNPNVSNNYFPFLPLDEEFRQISQYIPEIVDYFWVSNWGRVYSAYTGFLVPPQVNAMGYEFYTLRRKQEYIDAGKYPTYTIAGQILVCSCFNGMKPAEDSQVNHKDFRRRNNYYQNLEWVTPLENVRYSYDRGHYWNGNSYVNAKYTDVQARAVCEMLQQGIDDYHAISRQIFGCELTQSIKDFIRSIHIRRHWTHISKDYNFNADSKKRNFVDPIIFHGICRYMVEHPDTAYTAPYREVMAYLGIDVTKLDHATRSRYKSAVSAIRNNPNSQMAIRTQYNLPPDTRKIGSESGNSQSTQ